MLVSRTISKNISLGFINVIFEVDSKGVPDKIRSSTVDLAGTTRI